MKNGLICTAYHDTKIMNILFTLIFACFPDINGLFSPLWGSGDLNNHCVYQAYKLGWIKIEFLLSKDFFPFLD